MTVGAPGGAKIDPVTAEPRLPPTAVASLAAIVGGAHVLTDPDVVRAHTTDWTGRFVGRAPAVVRPAGTAEVAAVVAWCAEQAVALSVQGGNTGLSGGSVPLQGELVLSLTRLAGPPEVDAGAGQCTAPAGVPLAALHAAAAAGGWAYGVDLSSRDSATVGGTVATDAGGLRVVRHGTTRAQLLGVEAVLGTGAVVSDLRGLVKDVSGYRLGALLCGSEGTLGIVTAARLRLVAPTPERTVALLAFDEVADAVEAAAELRRSLPSVDALELFFDDGLRLVCGVHALASPFPDAYGAYLLAEAADVTDPTDALAEAVDSVTGLRAAAVAAEPERRAALWRYREEHSTAIASLGVPHKLDVSLPAGTLGEFLGRVGGAVGAVAPHATTWRFGHVGDNNVHVNVTGVAPDDVAVDDAVCTLAMELGGSISGEHGIGVAKRHLLARYRSTEELGAFRALRRALDPAGILNPGVLLPPG